MLGLFVGAACKPAEAQNYPWCAYYDGSFGGTNCGFTTFQQCLDTVSGIGGFCERLRCIGFRPAHIRPRGRKGAIIISIERGFAEPVLVD